MKRDIEVIKYILEKIEETQESSKPFRMQFKKEDDYSVEVLNYHLVLLVDSGFVNANIVLPKASEGQFNTINSITWEGYNLLDTLREDKESSLSVLK